MTIVGRKAEKKRLKKALESNEAEFIAIYGRRRVGKTFLVRQFVKPEVDLFLEFTGQMKSSSKEEMHRFQRFMEKSLYQGTPIPGFKSWNDAFEVFGDAIEDLVRKRPKVSIAIFLDELPWMDKHKAGLKTALDTLWNTKLSNLPNVKLIVCGSAASWMIDNLIHQKGGLYNRVTERLQILPFTIPETREYFSTKNIKFNLNAVIELYMAIGGIPYYLRQVDGTESPAQNIARIYFTKTGPLHDEFNLLFDSLFKEGETYKEVIEALAIKEKGLTRAELIAALKKDQGGKLTKKLRELEACSFISIMIPYNKSAKDKRYRIIDPFILFCVHWQKKVPKGIVNDSTSYWLKKRGTSDYSVWSGYAFETICLTHASLVQKALGIEMLDAEIGSWSYKPPRADKSKRGAQIDLVFDRGDNTVTLCEIKYYAKEFTVSKDYSTNLKNKIEVFERVSRTKKDIKLVMITLNGFKANTWSEDLVTQDITAEDIFI